MNGETKYATASSCCGRGLLLPGINMPDFAPCDTSRLPYPSGIHSHGTTPTDTFPSSHSGLATIPPNHTRAMPYRAALKSPRRNVRNACAPAHPYRLGVACIRESISTYTGILELTELISGRADRALSQSM